MRPGDLVTSSKGIQFNTGDRVRRGEIGIVVDQSEKRVGATVYITALWSCCPLPVDTPVDLIEPFSEDSETPEL